MNEKQDAGNGSVHSDVGDNEQVNEPTDEEKPQIYASRIFNSNDPLVFPFICTVLEKMANTSVVVPSLYGERTLIEMNEVKWWWKKVTVPENLKFKFPSKSCKNFYLLTDLGGGLDGRVWLACSPSFEVVVLKFPSTESTRDLEDLEKEATAWKDIYGVNAHVRKIAGANTIVLPYVYMFVKKDWEDKETLQLALEGCEHFADKGYKHHDLRRRHVGTAFVKGKLRAIFIDLSSVEKINPNDKDKVAEEMKKVFLEEKDQDE